MFSDLFALSFLHLVVALVISTQSIVCVILLLVHQEYLVVHIAKVADIVKLHQVLLVHLQLILDLGQ